MKLREVKFRHGVKIRGQIREGLSMESSYDRPILESLEYAKPLRMVTVTLKPDEKGSAGTILIPAENLAHILPVEWPEPQTGQPVKK